MITARKLIANPNPPSSTNSFNDKVIFKSSIYFAFSALDAPKFEKDGAPPPFPGPP